MANMNKESDSRLSDVTDAPITRAANNAARQVLQDEKRKQQMQRRKDVAIGQGCAGIVAHLFNGWLLMFVVALLGFPLGYWPCVLIAFTASGILSVGTHNGVAFTVRQYLDKVGK